MEWIEAEPGHVELAPGEVHLWRFPLEDPRHSDAAEAGLTHDERIRAEGMSSPHVRRSFVASQTALRHVLSGYTRTPPGEIEFSRGVHGKPMLASSAPTVEFNVTHSGDWGVVAVARCPVGIDVEQVRLKRAAPALQERFLTEGERELVRQRAESHGDAAFFIVWSRKEAYLKASGFGLAAPFSRVDSSAEKLPDMDDRGIQLPGPTPWAVQEFFVDERHPAAVVARAAQLSLRHLTLRSPDL